MPPENPPESGDVRDIAEHVQTVVWSLRRFGERQSGLTLIPHSELEVLRLIDARPGSTISEIARALELQSSNVSTTVRRLVERELVERVSDPQDRRSHRLHPTPLALKYRKMIDEAWIVGVRHELSRMSPDEAALLIEAAPLFRRFASLATDA
jgi:DNA-binding MarR family transcriptional regulator